MQSDAAVITEYRGLSVGDLKELRRSLGSETTYAVVKNTLTEIAAREAGIDGLRWHAQRSDRYRVHQG